MLIEGRFCCHHCRCRSHYCIHWGLLWGVVSEHFVLAFLNREARGFKTPHSHLNVFKLLATIFLMIPHVKWILWDSFCILYIPKLWTELELTLYFSIQSIQNIFHSLIFLHQEHLAIAWGIYKLFVEAHAKIILDQYSQTSKVSNNMQAFCSKLFKSAPVLKELLLLNPYKSVGNDNIDPFIFVLLHIQFVSYRVHYITFPKVNRTGSSIQKRAVIYIALIK